MINKLKEKLERNQRVVWGMLIVFLTCIIFSAVIVEGFVSQITIASQTNVTFDNGYAFSPKWLKGITKLTFSTPTGYSMKWNSNAGTPTYQLYNNTTKKYSLPDSAKGKITAHYSNVGYYKGEPVAMDVQVVDWKDPKYLGFDRNKIGVGGCASGTLDYSKHYIQLQISFSGSTVPDNFKGHFNISDLDYFQTTNTAESFGVSPTVLTKLVATAKNAPKLTLKPSNDENTAIRVTANTKAIQGNNFDNTDGADFSVQFNKKSYKFKWAGCYLELGDNCTINEYEIVYQKNATDATGTMANSHFKYGITNHLRANTFQRKGYTFKGWYVYRDHDNNWAVSSKYSTTGKTAFEQKHTSNTLSVPSNNSHLALYPDKGSVQYTSPCGYVYMFANWEINDYQLNFDANGGRCDEKLRKIQYNSEYGTLPTATKEGYIFNGWYTEKTGGTKVSSQTKMEAQDITVYAHWTPITYMIQYHGNNETSGITESSLHTYDVAKNLTNNGFTKTGHVFQGWATSPTGEVVYDNQQLVKNLTTTQDTVIHLYAKWKTNSYIVTFTDGLGTILKTESVNYGNSATAPSVTSGKIGYHQNGWDKKFDNITNNITVNMQWTPNSYIIQFNANGGIGIMENLVCTYDKVHQLPHYTYINHNHQFISWNTKTDGSGTDYKDEASIKNLTSQNNMTIVLYAQWDTPPEINIHIPHHYYNEDTILLQLGEKFHPKDYIELIDKEDKEKIWDNLVIYNPVPLQDDVTILSGIYKVKYQVKDNSGNKAEAILNVIVNEPPKIDVLTKKYFRFDGTVPLTEIQEGMKSTDKEDGVLTEKVKLISLEYQYDDGTSQLIKNPHHLDISKTGTAIALYEVTDSYGKTVTQEGLIEIYDISGTDKKLSGNGKIRFIEDRYINTIKEKSLWNQNITIFQQLINSLKSIQSSLVFKIPSKNVKKAKDYMNNDSYQKSDDTNTDFYNRFLK